jgi:hypothetical protein
MGVHALPELRLKGQGTGTIAVGKPADFMLVRVRRALVGHVFADRNPTTLRREVEEYEEQTDRYNKR